MRHRWGGRQALQRHFIKHINIRRIIYDNDLACYENTRMDRRAFHALCDLLSTTGRLSGTRNIAIEEMVSFFLHIIAHDVKNRVIKRQFVKSGKTISRHFSNVLIAILRCHGILLRKSEPISENLTDERRKWFKSHPNAGGLRGKSFPYFEELSIVFGKDRTTGIAAESPADAIANIEGEETNQRASAQNPNVEMAIADESSGLGPTNTSAGQSRKTRKRRS
ncbi:hypothetical protein ACMD2_13137 [Ananas comosus]|uniref:DUF8040 domain-containing protein n=1 Tax=Ananas comosus TaxID=4615 RepID=A0A199VRM7_ANACO|nr:hypothetical protein ACMD2_13137 [Ananas comosus]